MTVQGHERSRHDAQLIGLDAARFLAAMLVMIFHLGAYAWQAPLSTAGRALGGAAAYPGLFAWTWFGWIGVELFFVISGFVIAYSAEHATARAFLRSRLLRLVPAVWICATLTVLVSLAVGRMGSSRHLLHAYLDSALFVPVEPWIDGVYWTLGVEIAFYGLVFMLLLCGRYRSVGSVCAALGGASALFWIATLAIPGLTAVAATRLAELTLLRHGCFFALGVFLWLSLIKGATAGRLCVIALCAVGALIEVGDASQSFLAQMSRSESPLVPRLIFAGCVLMIAASVRGNAWLRDRLGARGCLLARQLGLMTYPLYLLHNVNGAALIHRLVTAGLPPYPVLLAACGAMLTVSFAVMRWAEPFVRSRLSAFLDRIGLDRPLVPARRPVPGL
ncbi:acyltransferase [Methylobacterium sp. P1-11]|uniref:acyltransferase family protein n=1 Tax=Methylobacterium sp. P1-11 TaxID=2024616 RepID=UPI0011EDFC3E|nr:acyltransferase [Methylobacterium sp. P1-11]KAA0123784.1 acyltransferase [Methylobacterium sp. P1-11]